MPKVGGVAPDVGFIDDKKCKSRCLFTQGTPVCTYHVSNKTCSEGVVCDSSEQTNYGKCSGNSPRKRKKLVQKEPLTAWAI
ncbi:hypothetical protein KJ761_02380 [Patescibacteria group bacterium]|nr:hypothetical protein [Patescibacteria group bacterium]